MMSLIAPHLPLLDLIFIGTGYALSQAIVFRAGTFSVATSGFAALGAYAAAIRVAAPRLSRQSRTMRSINSWQVGTS